ncbi:Nodule Cysteine-Rich (NCR) secreted peptide [Medicago truncatula]|uniref:Nodule Cysteine-Rich (NCR) secreted peptide n=2 Tax=Medicago truncatula TaxID=3880 RepID=G7JR68_MEDTR|nr:Nodule Cysteine-Rich (NCR) secreted peptide [Medicago truncatula]KEH28946.1 Nodule Cysteine-Rich (NCR) secreted peptide [Medicago truncatula]
MVETLKLVYVLILFYSIFLGIIVCNSSGITYFDVRCEKDKDCPKPPRINIRINIRCRKGFCVQI